MTHPNGPKRSTAACIPPPDDALSGMAQATAPRRGRRGRLLPQPDIGENAWSDQSANGHDGAAPIGPAAHAELRSGQCRPRRPISLDREPPDPRPHAGRSGALNRR